MQELIDEYKVVKAEFQKKLRAGLKDVFKEFFEKTPEIKTIRWTQYTPYFNDGEECVFSVNDPYFSNVTDLDKLTEYGELDDGNEGEFSVDAGWGMNYYREKGEIVVSDETIQSCKKLASLIQAHELEDVLRATFGDHSYVTITADKMVAEEYDHE